MLIQPFEGSGASSPSGVRGGEPRERKIALLRSKSVISAFSTQNTLPEGTEMYTNQPPKLRRLGQGCEAQQLQLCTALPKALRGP